MKISIITHPLEKNIGGIMQAYALQKRLRMNGFEVETVDFRPFQHNRTFRLFKYLFNKVMYALSFRSSPPLYEEDKYLKNKLFVKENMRLSKRIYLKRSLSKYVRDEQIQTIIVGSDQTWRPKYVIDLSVYFLGFTGDCKKFSYASSFGVSDWEYSDSETILAKKLIQKFKSVSVREVDGVNLCNQHLDTEAKCVADPTLLLSKDDYNELCQEVPRFTQEKYLFYYVLDNNKDKQKYADNLAKKLNLEILIVENKAGGLFLSNTDVEIGPKEWLSLFKFSEYVITDSYHGMVFSMKFQRQFLIFGNEKRGISRFSSLLNIAGLNERMILAPSNVISEEIEQNIHYSQVDSKLNDFILDSEDFLFGTVCEVES